jgi:ATP-binding cassette subfamily B multidrug efflux pump
MFRFFENLVDPYVDHPERDTPPQQLWPFLWEYSQPFKRVFLITALLSIVVAAIEIGLIYYMGRVVDLLGGDRAQLWADYGTELILVALFVVLIRPAVQGLDVLLLNNAIMPNFGTLIRWRAHKQVLRQSVGWFENDFAGRIANRIMQTPPAAGEVVFQVFDAISYSLAYLIGVC